MASIRLTLLCVIAMYVAVPTAVAGEVFVGVKLCTKCHDLQGEAWKKTAHAKAFDSLKPGMKADAKKKAQLDPDKDYTGDKQCLACHTTGFGEPTGFKIGDPPGGRKAMGSVGCESCHGAGKRYRDEHSSADERMKKESQPTPRQVLVETGQNFDYESVCANCHLAYEGSPHQGVKPPYTPFTPKVDAKYAFNFAEAVKDKDAMHEHYILKDIFTGEPVPAIRAELQMDAKELPQ